MKPRRIIKTNDKIIPNGLSRERLALLLYNAITWINDDIMVLFPEEEVKEIWMEEIGITSDEYNSILDNEK